MERGSGYIPERVNDFTWVCYEHNDTLPLDDALPQIVLADFRIDKLSDESRNVINQLLIDVEPNREALQEVESILKADAHNMEQCKKCADIIYKELFEKMIWRTPTIEQYKTVERENPLIAWVLAWGRTVNHYGISLHAPSSNFESFEEFMVDAQKERTKFNDDDGIVKGSKELGIEQAATMISMKELQLADGVISISEPFTEFIWRYSKKKSPRLWGDFYNDFIPQNANQIIKSVAQ